MDRPYDLLVIGAGIAGCEAAWRAAGQGAKVLLLSMSLDQLNLPAYLPALFLSHEDAENLQKTLEDTLFGASLSRSVTGVYEIPGTAKLIMTFDGREFSLTSKEALERKAGLDTRQALVKSLIIGDTVAAESIFGEVFRGKRALIAPGCYVKGRIRTGSLKLKSGRYGDLSADGLADSLAACGVEMNVWTGSIPEVVDPRRLPEETWKKAAEAERTSPFIKGNGRLNATKRPVLWREEGEYQQLLVPMGPRSEESFLVWRTPRGREVEAEQSGATVRMRIEQECLKMKSRGGHLPRTVEFVGSFSGAEGYLGSMRDGLSKASEILNT